MKRFLLLTVLLAHQILLCTIDEDGFTMYMDMADELIETPQANRNPNLKEIFGKKIDELLFMAAFNLQTSSVMNLIKNGANFKATNPQGNNLLHHIILGWDASNKKYEKTHKGEGPIKARGYAEEIIKKLASMEPALCAQINKRGLTPAHLAISNQLMTEESIALLYEEAQEKAQCSIQ